MNSQTPEGDKDGEPSSRPSPEMTGPHLPPGGPTETVDQAVPPGAASGLPSSEEDTDRSRPAVPAEEGACFGDYELVRRVAQGGMGIGLTLVQRLVGRTTDAYGKVQAIYDYFTDPAKMVRWMGAEATLDPRPGGVFRIVFQPPRQHLELLRDTFGAREERPPGPAAPPARPQSQRVPEPLRPSHPPSATG